MVDIWAVAGGKRGVGKTTTTWGLARALGGAGENVLVVDWDRSAPDLAGRFGFPDPAYTIRSVLGGRATLREAAAEGGPGVAVVAGEAVPNASETTAEREVSDLVDEFGRFDVVLIDTGRPFVATTGEALDAADGVLVVSTPDRAARRNTAVFHEYLTNHGYPLVGTVLTRCDDESPIDDYWDCALLACLSERTESHDPESEGGTIPSEYRRLADGIREHVERDDDGDDSRSVSRPNDGFLTPSLDEPEQRDGGTDLERSPRGSSVRPNTEGRTSESDDDDGRSTVVSEEDDSDRIRVSRRAVLTLVTGLVGAMSAGVLGFDDGNGSREEASVGGTGTEVVGFGYGGTPITETTTPTATEAGTTVATTVATLAGSDESRPAATATSRSPTETATTTTATNTTTTTTAAATGTETTAAETTAAETATPSTGGPSGPATATPTETTTATPIDDGDLDDYGELGYGEGGYGGTL